MILKNLIYILQSENYYPGRFLKYAYSHLAWWKLENRQKIAWTIKTRLIWVISVLLFWGTAVFNYIFSGSSWWIGFVLMIIGFPFFILISLILLLPFDFIAKKIRIKTAAKIISDSGATVIGITGSYGKTSTKEILTIILEQGFSVIKTSGNVNTDIGIADFIIENKEKFKKESIFIVEMGAFKIGEIEKICKMVNPIYSILTGINECHLERFGSLKNIIQGKFELPINTKKLSVLNFDDKNVRENFSKFSIKKSAGVSKSEAINLEIKENFEGLKFEWEGAIFETSLLAEHNVTLILLAIKIAKELGISIDLIKEGVKKIKPVEHRLQPIYNSITDIMVIDDSYNGNFSGIVSGVEVLSRAQGRKVVLTPGLVELGSYMEEVHRQIGDIYAKNVDLVLLIKNKMTDGIAKGLAENDFKNYRIYDTTEEAHADLKNILKKGDTIIFQNDLTDNYF